jgi:hypothetical protein
VNLSSPLGPGGNSTVLFFPMDAEMSTRNMVTVYYRILVRLISGYLGLTPARSAGMMIVEDRGQTRLCSRDRIMNKNEIFPTTRIFCSHAPCFPFDLVIHHARLGPTRDCFLQPHSISKGPWRWPHPMSACKWPSLQANNAHRVRTWLAQGTECSSWSQ